FVTCQIREENTTSPRAPNVGPMRSSGDRTRPCFVRNMVAFRNPKMASLFPATFQPGSNPGKRRRFKALR
ncbi:MAG: hypothetical protein KDJ78_02375, partial [Rhodobacteraceae bacterium]|nr:hypothetical protein [Paracoccaceae bacterium]